ncbi:hypothetical protein DL768_010684 [Monosporascus sp. mg162]|nr:hypothetical protein DL768_010684 [Monosporascus sp. mg162]
MVIKSQHPDLVIPEVDLWTYQFEREDRPFPDNKDPDTGRSYTWAQVKSTALEFGKGLKSQWGFERGDVLGFFSPNTIDYAPAFFGVHWAGGTASTANPTYTAKELAYQMKDSQAKGIITQVPFLPVVLEAAKAIGIPENRIILLGDGRDPSGKFKHFTEIRGTGVSGAHSRTSVDPKKDAAFIVYSSGTTGLPKGVPLTHYNIVANLEQLVYVDVFNSLHWGGGVDGKGDKQLAILPFFHVYVSIATSPHPPVRSSLTSKLGPHMYLVLALAKHPVVSKYDLSSIKWMNSGAAPLGRDLVDIVWQRLMIPVMQGYGLSETAPTLTKGALVDWAKFNGSVGRLLPNIEAKIVDLEGNELPRGQEGELWVRGPNVFPGYLNRPELQAETFSACGFFKTGDIGYVDDKGNFYITDRLKELIKYKGFQVAPAELEGLLLGHDEISDACVIPAFDKQRETEVPRAYVVVKPGVPRTSEKAAEIVRWLDAKVAQHKRLRGGVRFIDEVPKNASGKLLRRVLKDLAKKEDVGEATAKL